MWEESSLLVVWLLLVESELINLQIVQLISGELEFIKKYKIYKIPKKKSTKLKAGSMLRNGLFDYEVVFCRLYSCRDVLVV